ncbi:MAG: hypothetical protein WCI74_10565, partial [Actinomycetes bacterium]
LGSLLAIDAVCLERVDVALLMSIGCPLGTDQGWRRLLAVKDFPTDRVGGWLNVVNTRDPIPWGCGIDSHYPFAVDAFVSAGCWPIGPRGAHDPGTYMGTRVVRDAIEWAAGLRVTA